MKILILDNIRSAYNVGAIFRTADAAGVNKVWLVGYTPTPIDRFGRPQTKIQKTSLGASDEITWEHTLDMESLVNNLKNTGVKIVAVEQGAGSIPLSDFLAPEKVAYVLGNEVGGVCETVLERADYILELPMLGKKESLNVSVTAGIVLYNDL